MASDIATDPTMNGTDTTVQDGTATDGQAASDTTAAGNTSDSASQADSTQADTTVSLPEPLVAPEDSAPHVMDLTDAVNQLTLGMANLQGQFDAFKVALDAAKPTADTAPVTLTPELDTRFTRLEERVFSAKENEEFKTANNS